MLWLLLPGRPGIPRAWRAGRGAAAAAGDGAAWGGQRPPPGSRCCATAAGASKARAVRCKHGFCFPGSCWCSPAPLPVGTEIPAPAGARDEEPGGSCRGKGSRSRLSLQGCSYHQQSPAPAGKGTGHCPQASGGDLGTSGLHCSSQSAASPTQDEERRPGPASAQGEALQPCPGATQSLSPAGDE